jgi:ABC-type multidrug transport system fused ATPase/permease subunit
MKILWRLAKEAKKYRSLLIISILSTIALTAVNLIAPRLLSNIVSIISSGMTTEGLKHIFQITAILLGLYASRILFRFLANYLAHKAAWVLVQELRIKVYNKLQSFSIGYYHDKQTGDLMSRVITDTETFEQLYAHIIPETISNALTVIGVTVILLTINWKLALFTSIPIPFILLSAWIFIKKVRPNFQKTQKARGQLSAQLLDNFSGMHETQAFGQQQRATEQVSEKAKKVTTNLLYALKISGIFHPSVEFLTALGTVIVVGFGGYYAFVGSINVADIVAFLLYLTLFYAPITNVAQLIENAQQAIAGAERVVEIMDTPQPVTDTEGAVDIQDVKGYLEFEHVSFGYSDKVLVLQDISFKVDPGQMIAFVGATGVGKTTLTQLISRFYDPTGGRILLDGRDIRTITQESLHRNVAMVFQDTFLFNGTIAENIAFAMPDASQELVEQAAGVARIHDDIMEMPEKYETRVGERGTRLSGGQKQRVAIARAVLCNAPVLILDEATASVDVETEAYIQDAILELSGTKTIFAIAHRLSTVRRADIILVIEDGKIVQRGNHDALIAQEGIYRRMCRTQEKGSQLATG